MIRNINEKYSVMYIGKLGALDSKNIFYITHFYTAQVKTTLCPMLVYDACIYHGVNVSASSMCHFFIETLLIPICYFPPKMV